MADDGRDEDRVGAALDGRVNHLLHRYRSPEVAVLHAIFLDAAVLDVENLAQTDAVFVLADGAGNHRQLVVGDVLTQFVGRKQLDLLGDRQFGRVDVDVGCLALDLDEASLGRVQHLQVAHLRVVDAHLARHLDSCLTGDVLRGGDVHLHQDDVVASPLGLRTQCRAVAERTGPGQTGGSGVVRVELVDVDDLLGLAQGAAVDEVTRLVEPHGQVVVAEMVADRGEVVGVTLDDGSLGDTALAVTGDAVMVALREFCRVDEEPVLHGGEVPTDVQHFGEEPDGPLFEVADHGAQRPLTVDGDHVLDAVQGGPGLLDRLDTTDGVVVPGQVATLVRGDGALDVRARQHRDEGVDGVGADGFGEVGLDVPGVLLGAHLVLAEQITQGHRVRQVVPELRGRGSARRDRRQTDEILRHTHQHREYAVETVLDHQLGHDLPAMASGGIGVVGAVDLEDLGSRHHLLGLTGVDVAAVGVDVAVQQVVLRVLVSTVDSLLGEEDGHLRAGHSGDVGVEVDGASHLVLNEVAGLAAGAQLLAGDRDAANAFRGALEEPVDVALSGGADDHDVVGAVPGGHPHAAQVILEMSGGDLGGDDWGRLGIYVLEVLRGGQGHALLQRGGHVPVVEVAHVDSLLRDVAPGPSLATGVIVLEVGEDFLDVKLGARAEGLLLGAGLSGLRRLDRRNSGLTRRVHGVELLAFLSVLVVEARVLDGHAGTPSSDSVGAIAGGSGLPSNSPSRALGSSAMRVAASRRSMPSRRDSRSTAWPAPLPPSPAAKTFSTTAWVVTESIPMRSRTDRSIDGVVWVRARSTTGVMTCSHSCQKRSLIAASSRSASSARRAS